MSKENRPPPYVREGQVWRDNDPRQKGRTLRVERVFEGEAASCKVLNHARWLNRSVGGHVRIALHRFNGRRNGYSLVSEPSVIGKSAKERAQQVAGWAGFPDTAGSAFVELVERSFKEHARDQRHLCDEEVNGLECDNDSLNATARNQYDEWTSAMRADARAAVMNAPEPGMHNG